MLAPRYIESNRNTTNLREMFKINREYRTHLQKIKKLQSSCTPTIKRLDKYFLNNFHEEKLLHTNYPDKIDLPLIKSKNTNFSFMEEGKIKNGNSLINSLKKIRLKKMEESALKHYLFSEKLKNEFNKQKIMYIK